MWSYQISTTDALKNIWRRTIQKTAEGTGDSTGSQIPDIITKGPRTLPQNIEETVKNEHDE